MRGAALIAACLTVSAAVNAQTYGPGEGKAAIDSLLNSEVNVESALLFERQAQDLGTMTEDEEPRIVRFPFRNAGPEAVTVTRVSTTCGCTSAAVEVGGFVSEGSVEDGGKMVAPVTVEAGAEGAVDLTFNPRNRSGSNDVRAFVYTSESADRPAARLSLTSEVVETSPWSHFPVKMGHLRLMRNEVTVTLTGAAGKAVERILCVNAGGRPLTLSAEGLPPYARFRTEPETIEPGEEADLVISVDMEAADEWSRNLSGFSFRITGATVRPGPEEFIEVKIQHE
ncbi:MAG: DUF1573 domain-containing protein [Clostridia bacterium]|nr:DUF1573 domain-containing protein [Clostridia bacterium]